MTPEERANVLVRGGSAACGDYAMCRYYPCECASRIAAAIRAAENDALERAARECEAYDAERMAEDIRALKHGDPA